VTQHPITPPPELVQQLYGLPQMKAIEKAFEAGADQELEACCEWTTDYFGESFVANLRAARRPKPKSEKQQALDAFDRIEYAPSEAEDFAIIRRAIESIPDDQ
jgi:hypothetical protein